MMALSELYSTFTEKIPKNISVLDVIQADGWTLVESELGVGVAMSHQGGYKESIYHNWIGSPLCDLAAQVNSWNFPRASMGLAAINAYWNTESVLQEQFKIDSLSPRLELISILQKEQAKGNSIGSVGHFPFLDRLPEKVTIFEMNPRTLNEYPPSAAEYLLPQCNIVLLTASTLINKTFEPLIRLAEKAVVWLLGPSTTFAPQLINYNISYLGGLMVTNKSLVKSLVRSGARRELVKSDGVTKIQVNLRS